MSKSKFKYREKSAQDLNKQAQQSNSMYDRYTQDHVQVFKVQEGKNRIRNLPDTWEGADFYAFEVFLHYGVGPDKTTYLCNNKNEGGDGNCPICKERVKADREGDTEYAKELSPTKRVAVWLIDRANEQEGPKLWMMPPSLNRDIVSRCVDSITNEVLNIDHPEEGFDIVFSVEGAGIKRKYFGVEIARRSTPISDDDNEMEKWLDYIVENPLPSIFNYHPSDHIAKVFHGGVDEDASGYDNSNDKEVPSGIDPDLDDDALESRAEEKETSTASDIRERLRKRREAS